MAKTAKVTSKGQITIPAAVRKALRLEQGDTLVFEPVEGGVLMRRAPAEEAFSKYAGRYRHGEGKTRGEIVRELRELRGD